MSVWVDLATAVADCRAFLNDGPLDRPIKSKQVLGPVDGVNAIYVTLEDRLVAGTLVPTLDFVEQPPAAFAVLDLPQGRFQFTTPPPVGTTVRAHYYFQYFLDSDLQEAMQNAAGEVRETEDLTTIPVGLKNCTLAFAGYFGFTKQAIRWATRTSNKFILEEEPINEETMNRSRLFEDIAKRFFDQARTMRDDFYMRHGRRQAPASNAFKPRIAVIGTRR